MRFWLRIACDLHKMCILDNNYEGSIVFFLG